MAQIQKSIILKLRQEEATSEIGHGNFTTNLKKPILMTEGDVVKVHTAILDTSADGIVQVEDDGTGVGGITVNMDVALYNRFYENKKNSANTNILTRWPYPNPDTNPSSQKPTLRNYVACIGKGVPNNTFTVEFFTVYPLNGGFDKYGKCQLTFQFVSPMTGEVTTRQKYFKGGKQIGNKGKGIQLKIGWNVVGNAGLSDFKCIDAHDYLSEHKIDHKRWKNSDVQYSGNAVASGSVNLEPFIQRLSFVIPEGRYGPGEIASIITDKMSMLNQDKAGTQLENKSNSTPPKFPMENPFLSSIRQINFKSQSLVGNPYSQWFCPMYYEAEAQTPITNSLQYSIAALAADASQPYDIFVGAEQVGMNFDPVLKKLNFDIMHFPMYVGWSNGATNDAKPGIKFSTDGSPINTYGGAMITGLEPVSFWSKQLGFSDIIIDWNSQSTSFGTGVGNGGSGEQVFPVQVTPVVGQNITNVYDGLDTICQHNDNFMIPGTTASVQNSLTRPILASREFDVALNDEGYFLVEIGFKFPQSMIGGQMSNNKNGSMNNIQSIVGKYYTSDNNFVQDQGAGSITYEHHGEPQMLTDLQIRILNPDGSEPTETDIGVKNSIFLEIVKTLQA